MYFLPNYFLFVILTPQPVPDLKVLCFLRIPLCMVHVGLPSSISKALCLECILFVSLVIPFTCSVTLPTWLIKVEEIDKQIFSNLDRMQAIE